VKKYNTKEFANSKYAVIKTLAGEMKFELLFDDAPNTVSNFVSLAEGGFYNGLLFHRVVPNFVVQGGCPNGTGTGGPGYSIECEINSNKHKKGALSMAHRGKNSGGSQFFICLGSFPHLDGVHTVFANMIEGLDVLDKVRQNDVIESITIIRE